MSKLNRVWILAGQSWASGEALMATLQPNRQGRSNNLRIYQTAAPYFDTIDSVSNNNQLGSVFGSASFGPEFELIDLATYLDADVYILKYAVGGTYLSTTSVSNWNTGGGAGNLYDNLKTYITNAKAFMNTRVKSYKFEGIIWEQGAADANNQPDSDAYQTNLTNFINGINTHVNESNFRWYIEQIQSAFSNRVGWATVKAAQTAVVATNAANYRLIDVDDVTYDGTFHPDANGNRILGQHFVNAIKADI